VVKSRMGKHVRNFLLLCAALCGSAWAQAVNVPAYSTARVKALAQAIAKAEGFGIRGALPTRYHNPGDLKTPTGTRYPGQVRLGKAGHTVFSNDAAGWAALEAQIVRILQGNSRFYTLHTTINQMSRRYAANWRPWANQVTKLLHVPGTTTLEQWLTGGDLDVPPQITYTCNYTGVLYLSQNSAW
jgi:hypothetical protein